MKKFFLFTASILIILSPATLTAQSAPNGTANGDTDFIEHYIEQEESLTNSRAKARDLLSEKPNVLKLRETEERMLEEGARKREELAHKLDERKYIENRKKNMIEDITSRLQKAPFGLYWDATLEEMQMMDFILQPVQHEDYKGSYRVSNPQQRYAFFTSVIAVFGLQDHLWSIYAQSAPQEDEADASKVLKLYQQYYEALKKKYGNDKEFFTPYTYVEEQVEIQGEGEKQKKIVTEVTHENPKGGANFLKELQAEKTSLYATFENNDLGIILRVAVNEEGKSFITINYKNLEIMKNENNANLENLMDDL